MLTLAAVVTVAALVGGYLIRAATESNGTAAAPPAAMEPTLTYGTGGDLQEFTWDSGGHDGVCLNGDLTPGARITEDDHQVECTRPHLLEVFDWMVFWEKPDADDCDCPDISYPGLAELSSYAEHLCGIMFESEPVTDTSGRRYRALVPAEQTWDTSRTVACVLHDSDGDKMDRSFVTGK